ncbi:MAG: hypothetical protein M3042_00820 [Actinomycetota bacterium]|nr:hypothetical protein [Actinomycetota bacterium]
MSDELDRLLRDTLESQAQSYEPAGDGLTRIRARVDARRSRLRWLVPSVALVGASAAVAAILVAPHLLPARRTASPPAHRVVSPTPGPVNSPTPGGTQSPPPAGLPDLATVWPYPSRSQAAVGEPGDVSAGRRGYLTDPKATALHFARDFIGITDPLEATATHPLEAGLGVVLSGRNPNNQLFPVTTVYLVRVARGSTAPYVVVRADAPGLRVTGAAPAAPGVVKVVGRVAGIDEAVMVRALDAGGRTVSTGHSGSAGPVLPWTATLGGSATPLPSGRYVLVAQTASAADGRIAELVVRPYTQP